MGVWEVLQRPLSLWGPRDLGQGTGQTCRGAEGGGQRLAHVLLTPGHQHDHLSADSGVVWPRPGLAFLWGQRWAERRGPHVFVLDGGLEWKGLPAQGRPCLLRSGPREARWGACVAENEPTASGRERGPCCPATEAACCSLGRWPTALRQGPEPQG